MALKNNKAVIISNNGFRISNLQMEIELGGNTIMVREKKLMQSDQRKILGLTIALRNKLYN